MKNNYHFYTVTDAMRRLCKRGVWG